MIICVCVDDRLGTVFNNRRQSTDRVLRSKLAEILNGANLITSSYTAKQFSEENINLIIDDNPLDVASEGDYVFVEREALIGYEDKIEKIILYKWNRTYPYDQTFDIDLSVWKLVSTIDFEGSSHEKITEEIYEK